MKSTGFCATIYYADNQVTNIVCGILMAKSGR